MSGHPFVFHYSLSSLEKTQNEILAQPPIMPPIIRRKFKSKSSISFFSSAISVISAIC